MARIELAESCIADTVEVVEYERVQEAQEKERNPSRMPTQRTEERLRQDYAKAIESLDIAKIAAEAEDNLALFTENNQEEKALERAFNLVNWIRFLAQEDKTIPSFIQPANIALFLQKAHNHYYKTAPAWFVNYLEELSIQLGDAAWKKITLDELVTIHQFYYDKHWIPEQLAVNLTYKLFDRLGRDLTGLCDH